jgi:hypothetical protein
MDFTSQPRFTITFIDREITFQPIVPIEIPLTTLSFPLKPN